MIFLDTIIIQFWSLTLYLKDNKNCEPSMVSCITSKTYKSFQFILKRFSYREYFAFSCYTLSYFAWSCLANKGFTDFSQEFEKLFFCKNRRFSPLPIGQGWIKDFTSWEGNLERLLNISPEIAGFRIVSFNAKIFVFINNV